MYYRLLDALFLNLLRYRSKRLLIGKNVKIDFETKIWDWKGKIEIKDGVRLRSRRKGYHAAMNGPTCLFTDVDDAKISIGKNSRLNGVFIHAQKSIEIGEDVVIASGVNIIDSNGHVVNSLNRTSGRDLPENIVIGNNVWIGLNAIILKGSVIGNNSIIGAGSVVKGIFPSNVIIVGNPASIIGEINIEKQ